MFTLKPLTRRLVYVVSFEILAIALSTWLLTRLSKGEVQDSFPVAVAISLIAVTWNYVFNAAFEGWERRRQIAGRTLAVRVLHASAFEGGLFLLTIPLYMIWYGVGPWQAFKMEFVLLAFFLFYTFAFTWLFDALFALPRKAWQS